MPERSFTVSTGDNLANKEFLFHEWLRDDVLGFQLMLTMGDEGAIAQLLVDKNGTTVQETIDLYPLVMEWLRQVWSD